MGKIISYSIAFFIILGSAIAGYVFLENQGLNPLTNNATISYTVAKTEFSGNDSLRTEFRRFLVSFYVETGPLSF